MAQFKVVQVADSGFVAPAWVFTQLADAGIDFSVKYCESRQDLERYAGDADVAWVFGGSRVLRGDNLLALKRCGAILRSGSGTDNIDTTRATELGIIVSNTPDAVAPSVADQTVALLLCLARRVVQHHNLIHRGIWDFQAAMPHRDLQCSRLGLIGFGRIPRLVVKKLAGFEMQIRAYDPYADPAQMAGLGVQRATWDEVFGQSDYVSVHCPLTDETRCSIGAREFQMMPAHALFLNTSRGPVVDEPALIRALQEGRIAGAGLDVLQKEPPDSDNPLLTMENVIITPHIGGTSAQFPLEFYEHSVEAILDLAAGRWPRSVVNPGVTPRRGELLPAARRE